MCYIAEIFSFFLRFPPVHLAICSVKKRWVEEEQIVICCSLGTRALRSHWRRLMALFWNDCCFGWREKKMEAQEWIWSERLQEGSVGGQAVELSWLIAVKGRGNVTVEEFERSLHLVCVLLTDSRHRLLIGLRSASFLFCSFWNWLYLLCMSTRLYLNVRFSLKMQMRKRQVVTCLQVRLLWTFKSL